MSAAVAAGSVTVEYVLSSFITCLSDFVRTMCLYGEVTPNLTRIGPFSPNEPWRHKIGKVSLRRSANQWPDASQAGRFTTLICRSIDLGDSRRTVGTQVVG